MSEELDLGTQSHLGSAAEETEPDEMVWRDEALLPLKKNQHLGFQDLVPMRHALNEVGWGHDADSSVELGRETCQLLVHKDPHHAQLASGSASHGYMGQGT